MQGCYTLIQSVLLLRAASEFSRASVEGKGVKDRENREILHHAYYYIL
jgi:hypothetical protein